MGGSSTRRRLRGAREPTARTLAGTVLGWASSGLERAGREGGCDRHPPGDIGDPEGQVRNETHRLLTEDGELRIRIRGRGPRLLLLHGLTAHGGVWEEVADRLEERYTLVIPDLLSRGASEARPDLRYGLERELGRARAVTRATGTAGRPVVGHSQGAALAAGLAAGPEPPSGLVLVCPVTPWTPRPAILDVLRCGIVRRGVAVAAARLRRPACRWVLERRVFADADRVDRATVERYAAPWAEPHRARTLLRVVADWEPVELAARLPRAAPPCQVLAGARDRRIDTRRVRRLAERLDAGFERVEEAAHMVPVEAPGAVVRALERVSEEHRPGEEKP